MCHVNLIFEHCWKRSLINANRHCSQKISSPHHFIRLILQNPSIFALFTMPLFGSCGPLVERRWKKFAFTNRCSYCNGLLRENMAKNFKMQCIGKTCCIFGMQYYEQYFSFFFSRTTIWCNPILLAKHANKVSISSKIINDRLPFIY